MWDDFKEFTLPLFSYVCMVMGAFALSLLIFAFKQNPMCMIVIMMCVLFLAIYYVGKIIWLSWEQYKVTITAAWRGKTYSEDLLYEFVVRCVFLGIFILLFGKLATFIF